MNSPLTHSFRDGSLIRDRAILDLLQLQELGLVPGSIRAQRLQVLWGVTQPQVSRRMAEVDRLGLVAVRSGGRRYRLFTADDIRAQRWETVRRRLLEATT